MDGKVDVDIKVGYPYLENNPEITAKAKNKAIEVLGNDKVIDLELRMTAEDFAYYSQVVPATFIRVGTRNEVKGLVHTVHNAHFDIDENALQYGIQTLLAQVFIS